MDVVKSRYIEWGLGNKDIREIWIGAAAISLGCTSMLK
jgi:hypothetical protein